MTDDRWNKEVEDNSAEIKKLKLSQDQKMIEKFALSIKRNDEFWVIYFSTRYGTSSVIYYLDSGKWRKTQGSAKGLGANSMLRYFNPEEPKRENSSEL